MTSPRNIETLLRFELPVDIIYKINDYLFENPYKKTVKLLNHISEMYEIDHIAELSDHHFENTNRYLYCVKLIIPFHTYCLEYFKRSSYYFTIEKNISPSVLLYGNVLEYDDERFL
jgi:hypothetical protein